ncbi:hypothetical protein, conserved [Eimeria brunetti]|uniref:Uncharacterized protein n=1 Tax=Eimeria brunetti TaxID=51314 RepID=U6LHM1_9EIME|nr:hypothetical protein, conserved [Eimeria brunetti]
MDEMRATLDSLMGRDRNEYGANAKKGASFKAESVCKFFLLDFCPHDLFPNTRVDLGPCDREHRADLKVAFEADPEKEFYQALFETEFARYLQRLVDQMENRIKRVQQRIDANNQPVELSKENEERVNAMNAEISELLKQQDEAGSKGDIDAAEKLNEKVAFLQREVSRFVCYTQDPGTGVRYLRGNAVNGRRDVPLRVPCLGRQKRSGRRYLRGTRKSRRKSRQQTSSADAGKRDNETRNSKETETEMRMNEESIDTASQETPPTAGVPRTTAAETEKGETERGEREITETDTTERGTTETGTDTEAETETGLDTAQVTDLETGHGIGPGTSDGRGIGIDPDPGIALGIGIDPGRRGTGVMVPDTTKPTGIVQQQQQAAKVGETPETPFSLLSMQHRI